MDIRNWPLDQIMQLPDCCFGRRDLVTVSVEKIGAGFVFAISPLAFPERMVIWEFWMEVTASESVHPAIRVLLGDVLPTTIVQGRALEPLFANFGVLIGGDFQYEFRTPIFLRFNRLKKPMTPMGRRLILQESHLGSITVLVNVGVVFSSIPREVPDCLVSEYLRSQ